eukprot:763642-Hanusia_phi.AAC.4
MLLSRPGPAAGDSRAGPGPLLSRQALTRQAEVPAGTKARALLRAVSPGLLKESRVVGQVDPGRGKDRRRGGGVVEVVGEQGCHGVVDAARERLHGERGAAGGGLAASLRATRRKEGVGGEFVALRAPASPKPAGVAGGRV